MNVRKRLPGQVPASVPQVRLVAMKNKINAATALSILVLASWIPVLLALYPLPRIVVISEQVSQQELQAPDSSTPLRSSLDDSKNAELRPQLIPWLIDATGALFGLLAGIMGILNVSGWSAVAMLSAITSLALYWANALTHRLATSLLYFPTDSFVVMVLQEKLRFSQFVLQSQSGALSFYRKVLVVYSELAMPTIQVIIVIGLLLIWYNRRHASNKS